MSEQDLISEINRNKARLHILVNNRREALNRDDVYKQSCRLDLLIVEYMKRFGKEKLSCV